MENSTRLLLQELTGLLTVIVYSEEFRLLKKPRGSSEELPERAVFEFLIGRAQAELSRDDR